MRTAARRRLPWPAVAVVVVASVALVVASRPGENGGQEGSRAARVERITEQLRCPTCQGLSVADSPSSTARAIRDDVARRVAGGQGDDEVKRAYVDRYGEWILLRPRSSGIGALAWALPAAAFTVAGVGLALFFRRRGRVVPAPRRRRILATGAVVVFAAVAAALLARSLGERLPGETVTGNEQLRSEYAELMSRADRLAADGKVAEALRRYDEAARLEPGAAEPRVRSALIVLEAGLVDEALARLDEAEAADAGYAETWFARGLVLARNRDQEGARAAFARYLELAPDGLYAEDARVAVDELDKSSISTSKNSTSEKETP